MQQRTTDIKMLRMQALSILPVPHPFLDYDDFVPVPEKLEPDSSVEHQIHHNNEENLEEQEFSFACIDSQGTLIFADEIFDHGQIKPIFPAFNQSLLFTSACDNVISPLRPPLKKLFVEQGNSFRSEPQNEPLRNTMMVEVEASKECCKKSNSTGFSKLWRFRQNLKLRSNSNSKDTLVFLNPPKPARSNESKKVENGIAKKGKSKKCKTTSAHEKLYVMNRMRNESNKRRSFLPYRQKLVGFFANVNGFSKNLHPF